MKRKELLQKLSSTRMKMLATLEKIPEEQLLVPGVIGDWSIKDLLTHLTMWEAELVTMLWQIERGRKPSTAHFGPKSVDQLNDEWHQSTKDREYALVFSDYSGVRKQTERRVMAFSDEDLTNPKLFSWLKGKPLWNWIANDSFEHEEEHHAEITAWIKNTAN